FIEWRLLPIFGPFVSVMQDIQAGRISVCTVCRFAFRVAHELPGASAQPIELEMKALQLALRIVIAGLLLLALAFASYRAGFNARCQVGNMTGTLPSNELQAVYDARFDWARRAVMCSMGDYHVLSTNEHGQRADLFIIRKARSFLLVNDKETDLVDDSGKH